FLNSAPLRVASDISVSLEDEVQKKNAEGSVPEPRQHRNEIASLVTPRSEVGAGRRGFGHAVEDLRQVLKVVMKAGEVIGEVGVAIPAVLRAIAVLDLAVVGRILSVLQKILDEVNGVIEEEIVGAAAVNVKLAL